jgi:hypothetical protein
MELGVKDIAALGSCEALGSPALTGDASQGWLIRGSGGPARVRLHRAAEAKV